MDAVRARGFGRGDQAVDAQIAVGGRRRADGMRLVGEPHMQRVRVGFRIDRDGAQTQPLGGAGDAAGDFAAIGDQDGFEHERTRIDAANITLRMISSENWFPHFGIMR